MTLAESVGLLDLTAFSSYKYRVNNWIGKDKPQRNVNDT